MSDAELKTYAGNCHCGAIKFTVQLPPLESTPTPLTSCGCSICTKKGYLFVVPRKSAVTVTKGGGADGLGAGVLKDYAFNSKQVAHRFCGTCGTPFGIFALNARMLNGVDLWGLDVKETPGPAGSLPYTPPVFPGLADLTKEELVKGEKIYGGAATAARCLPASACVPLLPINANSSTDDAQHAGLYTYPRPLARVPVHFSPPDALTTYFSAQGKRFGGNQFCSTCGVVCFQQLVGPPAERVAQLPPNVQAMIKDKCDCRPVMVRALDFALGLTEEDKAEWGRVRKSAKRERGSTEGAAYVVPE
ncbi:Mss4-like protein [Mycena latifolia]|nr:Mss4-like protein [Mycena latifolia]